MTQKPLAILSLAAFLGACGPAAGGGGFGSDPGSKGPSMNGSTGGGSGGGGSGGGAGAGGGGAGGGAGGAGGSGSLVDVSGGYDVTTQFNLLDALPPDVKEALSLALELADSPGQFLLD